MRRFHANLLGTWVELDDELDSIFNEQPSTWLEEHNLHDRTFVWIRYKGIGYNVHVSQIQITNYPVRALHS